MRGPGTTYLTDRHRFARWIWCQTSWEYRNRVDYHRLPSGKEEADPLERRPVEDLGYDYKSTRRRGLACIHLSSLRNIEMSFSTTSGTTNTDLERQPLLNVNKTATVVAVDERRGSQQPNLDDVPNSGNTSRAQIRVFASLSADSLPVILSYVLQNSIQTVAVVIVGRLGPDELSAAAFALMLAFVTG
ncbi:hypothetical protein PLICRDRAFT_304293 [Plicaturopsis crispa FD-325 SS-3]|nr:hypothetical protein PLICRDRAFT_304293 [Plicaturopsis crispa FD-325 SS-3]